MTADAFIGTEDYSNMNRTYFEVDTRELTACRPSLPSGATEILAAGTPSKKTSFVSIICCKTHPRQQFAYFDCSFHSILARER